MRMWIGIDRVGFEAFLPRATRCADVSSNLGEAICGISHDYALLFCATDDGSFPPA